ncbi:NADP-dependent oxidoreductase domain-containing protein, partial [Dissophora ornata]
PRTAGLKLPNPQNTINRMESWRALEDLYHAKKLRAIGVSNYTLTHLTQLVDRPPQRHPHTPSSATAEPGSEPSPSSVSQQQQPHEESGLGRGARTMVVPHVHQFEMHPRLLQRDLLDFCHKHRIQVQAYSSLGEGRLVSITPPPPPAMDAYYKTTSMLGALDIMPDLIRKYFISPSTAAASSFSSSLEENGVNSGNDDRVESMEIVESDEVRLKEYSTRAAQILLRWGLQHGAVVIPKSTHPDRIRNNIDLFGFEIDENDMAALDAYSIPGERTRYCWDPTGVC